MVILLMLLLAIGALVVVPAWPYSREWGPVPSGALGLGLVILIVLALVGG
jgi:hypothetical protein